MIRIGIGSWTWPWAVGFSRNPYTYPKINAMDLIDLAASNDIHLVQLYNNIDLLSIDISDLREIRLRADQYTIDLEIGGMGIEDNYLQDLLSVADLLGSRRVRTVITPPDSDRSRYDVDTVVAIIRNSISEFENTGRSLLIENHDRYTSSEYREIVERVNSEALGICFDSANSLGKIEHFRDSFRVLRDFVYSCHYKEYSIKRVETNLGFIIQGCCPGQGENISNEFFGLIQSLGKDMDVVLEQWVPFQGTVEDTLRTERLWADRGIQILKSYST